jgi:hypothetical protein
MASHVWGAMSGAALVACVAALPIHLHADEGDWQEIGVEAGIVAWKRGVANISLLEFRGRGVVAAPIQVVTAVVFDGTRGTEWLRSCAASADLEHPTPTSVITYNRTQSPFPMISDRDAVLTAQLRVEAASRTVFLDFHDVGDVRRPVLPGVVRVPKLRGFFAMRQLDAHTTEVTYQVLADAGGALPIWLVNLASADLPLKTLQALRLQAIKPGYDGLVAHMAEILDWRGFDVPNQHTASASHQAGSMP